MSKISLLFGTENPAKLNAMRDILRPLGLEITGLCDMDKTPPEVSENGNDPLENACEKALAYFRFYGVPVFSMDSGLYFDNVSADIQPGIHVRNIGGKRLSDDEMIEYYGSLAKKYGRLTARYKNAVCIVLSDNEIIQSMDESLWGKPFYIIETPHAKRRKGFPLDSLSVEISSGRYYFDLPETEDKRFIDEYRSFFGNVLKEKLL